MPWEREDGFMSKAERICCRCSGTRMVPLSPRLLCAPHPCPVHPSVHCCSLLVGVLSPLAAPKLQPPAIQSRLPCHPGNPGDLVTGEEKQTSECFLEARPCDKVTRAGLCTWTDLAPVSAVTQELCHLGKIFFLLFAVLRGKLGQVLLYRAVQGRDESVS